jgi:FlaA1/EpsC-like NDP-sugar epimerase
MLSNRIQMKRVLQTLWLLLADCAILVAAYAGAIWLYTYLSMARGGFFLPWLRSLPFQGLGCIVLFFACGMHRVIWGHASVIDLVRLVFASIIQCTLTYVSLRVFAGFWLSPILAVTAFAFDFSGVIAVRFTPKFLLEWKDYLDRRQSGTAGRIPILIIGAGASADALLHDLQRHDKASNYRAVGIIDDDTSKTGLLLRGVPILGTSSIINSAILRSGAREIVIALPSATLEQRRELISECTKTGCRVRMMDSISNLGDAMVAELRTVNIADLLGRGEVVLGIGEMSDYITGKSVLITGGGGSIGSELCRQILRFAPSKLVIYDWYENNAYDIAHELRILYAGGLADAITVRIGSVQDAERLREVFIECQPEIVFHAAAYKHVPLMEDCPDLAVENNVFGTYNTAKASIQHNVKRFVMISTDKAVNPSNVMGATKRLSEMIIHSLQGNGTVFCAVRFGNVLGSNGSVVPVFKRQIESGGPVTVTHPEVIRFFMTIAEAVSLVLQAGAKATGGETFVLDMGEPVKIAELARLMIEMAGLIPGEDIKIEFTGLRPGEKLYEEILIDSEKAQKTEDEKIYIAYESEAEKLSAEETVDKLKRAIKHKNNIRAVLKELVPSYSYIAEENS